MSKICGLVTERPGRVTEDGLNAAYDASWHNGYCRKEKWLNGRVGLGHFSIGAVNTEPQPVFGAQGRDAIVFCGKIFDTSRRREALTRLGALFHHKDNDAEFMLNLLNHMGWEAFREINGVFSLAVWNAEEERLTLVSDRYGLRSLYYYHDASHGVFVFSSDLRGVVDSGVVQRRVNWPACSNFLYFGHHLGNETKFCDVHLMPPASVITFENNKVQIESYWNINSISIDDHIDYPTALEESSRLFTEAIRRQNIPTACKKAVFLSGGLDSRRIAVEMKRQGSDFETFTAGWDENSADPLVARKVADALSVKNTLDCLPQRNLMIEYWPLSNAMVDYETKMHQWIVPLVEALPEDVKINYDGLAGDMPFNGMRRESGFDDLDRFQEAQALDDQMLAERIVGPEMNLCVLSDGLRRHLCKEHVVQSVKKELEKYSGTRNQIVNFYLMNRTRRATVLSALKLLLLKVETFFPFLDNNLYDFIMSVPPELKIAHRLREDICKTYPEISKIPVAEYTDLQGRKIGWEQHPFYMSARRQYFFQNVRHRYLSMNWAFNNFQAGPRVMKDLLLHCTGRRHISYVFNEGFSVFFDWLARYFHRGLQ